MSITIVTGPPASGKTTYVNKHKMAGDLVVDVDALYHALSGLPWYEKPEELLPFVLEARDAVINRLSRESEVRRAWIITSESSQEKLRSMRDRLSPQAEILVLIEGLTVEECMKRIRKDERRAQHAELWRPLVERWFAKWQSEVQPWGEGDQISGALGL